MAIYSGVPCISLDLYEVGKRDGYEMGKRENVDKILNLIKSKAETKTELVGDCDEAEFITYFTIADYKLDEIAKQFGTDIKEGSNEN